MNVEAKGRAIKGSGGEGGCRGERKATKKRGKELKHVGRGAPPMIVRGLTVGNQDKAEINLRQSGCAGQEAAGGQPACNSRRGAWPARPLQVR